VLSIGSTHKPMTMPLLKGPRAPLLLIAAVAAIFALLGEAAADCSLNLTPGGWCAIPRRAAASVRSR
jgi:hypothetical protein